ncbi:hypothetical protein SXGG_00032 [Synechococcus phage S-CBP42]|uniref:Uncharacterized protein n=1 Tax=Synechococcus phage S-CBP42 TaxID=461711 RepID=G8EYE9_9CAUD|nr:hypothetical protein AVU76_gp36 [Synechococcus phage S-CBP42]AET72529.1 hypothetical protein SXGG_00032 [Synechococcus phage S-CBP42]AGK86687.1 hypothetical protein S-CBP42_0036 [Synechococcus phage S-CBP42]
MNTNVTAILATYKLATIAEVIDGKAWYPRALQIAQQLAATYRVSLFTAAGVIAALSPRNKWDRNVLDAENLIAAFKADPASAATVKVCTFTSNKRKALTILEANPIKADEVCQILSGPKLQEFFSCIIGADNEVCIDGHAFCIWNAHRTGLADVPAIGVKLRRQIKADYIEAANEEGIAPAAMQAITWVVWRRLHGVA